MNKPTFLRAIIGAALIVLTACAGPAPAAVSISQPQAAAQAPFATATSSALTVASGAAAATAVPSGAAGVAAALAANAKPHDTAADAGWQAAPATTLTLNGNAIAVEGTGVTVAGAKATITAAGTYRLSGTLSDGQIVVDAQDMGVVRLVLNGVDIRSSRGAAIQFVNAKEAVIVLADKTVNTLSDAKVYTFDKAGDTEPNAALFSKVDLTIAGAGALTVNANYNDGIASKDGLIIAGGAITVKAADDGIRGKDYLVIRKASLTVTAQGDGLKSDDEEDAARGYILIESGTLAITAQGDAIAAQTDVLIQDGTFSLVSGGGSAAKIAADASAKAIKGNASVIIDGGTFTINAADDGVHSNASIVINGGAYTIATGDDGLHADASLTVNGGDINITRSYEGIESQVITLNGGDIQLVSSDDGVNVAGGTSAAAGARPGAATAAYTGKNFLYVRGGRIVVDAGGDGIDVNGAVEMSGGVVIVNGPVEQMNGAVDYDGYFKMTGGFLVAAGSAGMAQTPGAGQNSALIYLNATQPAGTLFHIRNSAGETILTFAPSKPYQSVAFSSPSLVKGATYQIFLGGSASGTAQNGLYPDGGYSPAGAAYASFTVSSAVTTVGSGGRGPGGRP
ncbi:MAG: carbohydrate-binding domain-containing protein [Thermoflexales bacterium]|nr:carbohydrate-binding domain-containing protein [Thermoflexales bacterium]